MVPFSFEMRFVLLLYFTPFLPELQWGDEKI
jgi:hypothetical protein